MSGEPASPAAARDADRRKARIGWGLLALVTAGYYIAFAYNPGLFYSLGVVHYDVWFLDMFALLASNDAVTIGINPYAPNPLDYFGRPHVYSHWWLHLRDLGLVRADSLRLGLGVVMAFFLAAMWRLRPQAPRQFLWYLSILWSPAILLGLERANNDLVIFILLAPLVPCLSSRHRFLRLVPPLLVMVAAMLKYYPAAAALVLLAYAERSEMRPRLWLTLLLMGLAGLSVAGDLTALGPLVPQPEGIMSFGATGLMLELGWTGWGPKLLAAGIGLATVGACWRRQPLGDWAPTPAQRSDYLHFIVGAVLLTGCFFANTNFAYRLVFAVWLAPALWWLPRDLATPAVVRRFARAAQWLLFLMLWWPPFSCTVVNLFIGVLPGPKLMLLVKLAYLLEQPMDWGFFLCMLVFLTHFARRQLAEFRRSAGTAPGGAVDERLPLGP